MTYYSPDSKEKPAQPTEPAPEAPAAEEELLGYDKAFADLKTFRASFSLLDNAERERLIRQAMELWMPNVSSFQKEMLINMSKSFWTK